MCCTLSNPSAFAWTLFHVIFFRRSVNIRAVTASFVCNLSTLPSSADRVLTFKSLMLSMGLRVEWVRGATFHYEAMDSWRMLLAQRKRWNNGTAAAFLFFLFSRDGLLDIPTSGLEHPRIVQLMWGMQL